MNNDKVCMPYNYFMFFVIAGIAVMIWSLYQVNKQSEQLYSLSNNKTSNIETLNQNLDELIDERLKGTELKYEKKHDKMIKLLMEANTIQREQDYQRMANPFIPPLQRGDYSPTLVEKADNIQREQDYQRLSNQFIPSLQRGIYSPMLVEKSFPINIPTHGEYGNFQQVGYAYKPNDADQMFKLFGRKLHSNKYEYYVVHPSTEIKIPIKVKNDWEINNDERIIIKGFAGDFKVEIYDLDQPRYVPY